MELNRTASSDIGPALVLTNDDGWDAPGLAALRQAAHPLGRCQIVAPSGPISGCGHRVTTHGPIMVARPGEDCVSVDGTPADCVRLALHHLARAPAWVLSGINAGGNLGTDIYYSGTVAAAREAVIHGVPAIALSQYMARGRVVDWQRAARLANALLRRLMAHPWQAGTFWNVNLPHLGREEPDPEVVFCLLDPSPLPLTYQVRDDQSVYTGDYQSRPRREGSDIDVCFGGRIAVTLIHIADDRLDSPQELHEARGDVRGS
jgi:5'-nucleotidase